MFRRCTLAFIYLTVVIFVPAVASTEAEPVLEEVRVFGSRDTAYLDNWEEGRSISHDEQLSLGRSVADWIAALPGVSLNGQGGLLQAYSIRGFSRARVRTEVDGVPILTDRRAGNSASFVPPALLQTVRVDSSAASSLYGSGALGGVVHMQTLQDEGTTVEGRLRSNDQLGELTLADSRERRTLALSLRHAEDGETPDGEPLHSRFRQAALLLRGRSQWRDGTVEYSWLPSVGRDIGRSNSAYPDTRVSTTPEELHSLERVEFRTGGHLLRLYHHYQDWDSDVLRVDERRNLTRYRGHTVGGLYLAEARTLPGRGSWGLEWLGRRGVEITEREIGADGVSLPAQRVVDGDEDTLGLFVDQQWSVGAVDVKGVLRMDRVAQSAGESHDDFQPSGSLGLTYYPATGWTAGVEAARAFRFPSLSERYFNGTTPRGDVLGNPDLEPEVRQNLDVSLRYESDGGFAVAWNGYVSDLDNYIERVDVTDTLLTYRNVDAAQLWGMELDLHWRTGVLTHQLSYQWQQGEADGGETLADLNPPAWRYYASWYLASLTLRSDLMYRPARSRYGSDELPLDEALVWGLALAGSGNAGGLSWELQLNNVLDESYRGSADSLAPLQPGRSLSLVLRWVSSGA